MPNDRSPSPWVVALAVALLAPTAVRAGATKVMFVTSATGNADLSSWPQAGGQTGLAAGDAICQDLASSAGLANPSLFRAWLSTSTTDAFCHVAGFAGTVASNCGQATLPDSGPWVRADGVPFSFHLQNLVVTNTVLFVPRIDENGNAVGSTSSVWTATAGSGTVTGATCNDWQSASGSDSTEIGSTDGGAIGWTSWSGWTCDQSLRLFCFESGSGGVLPAFRFPGAYAFVTSVTGNGDLGSWPQAGGQTGLAAGDAICRNLAAAAHLPGASDFVAWLSTATTNAKDRLTIDGPWRRASGPRIAGTKSVLTSGTLLTDVETDELGEHVSVFTATGTFSGGTASGNDCNGWTSSNASDSVDGGWSSAASFIWTSGVGGNCDSPFLHLYCFGNRVVLFADGFESGNTGGWTATAP